MTLDMKQLMLLLSAVFVSFASVAAPSSFGRSSSQLNALGSAWKSYHSIQPSLNKNDIEMGYGGQDISQASVISLSTGIA